MSTDCSVRCSAYLGDYHRPCSLTVVESHSFKFTVVLISSCPLQIQYSCPEFRIVLFVNVICHCKTTKPPLA